MSKKNLNQRPEEPDIPPVKSPLDAPTWSRLTNYYLLGERNWAVDRDFADMLLAEFPAERSSALRHRLFLHRAVRYMAMQGISQFVDIGSGIPDKLSVHAVADSWSKEKGQKPAAKVCYIDHDSLSVAYGSLDLEDRRHTMIDADLRKPHALWDALRDQEVVDVTRPLGILVTGTMQMKQVDELGKEIGPDSLAQVRELMPTGSYLAVSHTIGKGYESVQSAEATAHLDQCYQAYARAGVGDFTRRTQAEIEGLLGDCEPVEQGWARAEEWGEIYTGADAPPIAPSKPQDLPIWAAVGKN